MIFHELFLMNWLLEVGISLHHQCITSFNHYQETNLNHYCIKHTLQKHLPQTILHAASDCFFAPLFCFGGADGSSYRKGEAADTGDLWSALEVTAMQMKSILKLQNFPSETFCLTLQAIMHAGRTKKAKSKKCSGQSLVSSTRLTTISVCFSSRKGWMSRTPLPTPMRLRLRTWGFVKCTYKVLHHGIF